MIRLNKLLKDRGITPKELADKMGVPKQKINAILKGHKGMNISTLHKIAKALNVPASYLLEDFEDNICPHCGKKLSEKLGIKK